MEKIKVVVGNYILKAKNWIKENPVEAAFLFIILLVAAFMRLYRISEYMTFLGDEGRDVIIVRRLLVYADPILIGPGTSIGNMYLGPLYYYMMAPALFLAGYSPVGPAVQIALLGVATVFLVWYVSREWFGKVAAPAASFLYAVSPVVIIFSRSSWNRNIMPFFSLLCIWATWQFWKNNKFHWILIAGLSFAFVLQSHYLGLLLLPVMGLFWLLKLLRIRRSSEGLGKFLRNSLVAIIIFAGLMSPLVIFDARHGWRNFSAMKQFFAERQTTVSIKPWKALPILLPVTEKVVARLVLGTQETEGRYATNILALISAFVFLFVFYRSKLGKDRSAPKRFSAYLLLFVWLGVALVGLALYKQQIYDHYYGFFFTAPFLLIGGLLQEPFEIAGKKITFFTFFSTIAYIYILAMFSVRYSPLRYLPGRQLQNTIQIAQKIKEESGGKKFNLAVIAERNYEDAYQYFLEVDKTGVTDIDSQRLKETVGDELFVVCELPADKCDPTHNPKAEIANFGWSKIDTQWTVGGTVVYKLVHSQ